MLGAGGHHRGGRPGSALRRWLGGWALAQPARWAALLSALLCAWAAPPAAGQVPDWSLQARQRLQGGPEATAWWQQRQQWLAEAEQQLARGDAAAAEALLDRAAGMLHAPDTEAALVRSQMQAGDYRRALAFGAHAAGAHRREWPAGSALYVWLLQVGGQAPAARHYLADALERAPDDPALLATHSALANAWPQPGELLLQAPLRLAPWPWGAAVPDSARSVGSAVLVGADQALAPAALLGAAADPARRSTVWLRNGLGQTVAATPVALDEALGLVLLRLASPLPPADIRPAPREPFAGSPGYLVEYPPLSAQAAWPVLRQGFFARQGTTPGLRPLGIDAPPGPRGGPVFNAAGQLAGLAVAGDQGLDRLLPVAALQARFGLWPAAAAPGATGAPTTGPAGAPADVDLVYERALRCSLQLLLLP